MASSSYPAYGGQGPELLKVGWSFAGIATVLMALRIYTRVKVSKAGTVALIWALFAWLMTIITQCFGALAILHGLGNHITVVVETGEASNFLFFTWMTFFFFITAIAVGKAAFCAFLLEIQAGTNRTRSVILYTLAIANVAVTLPLMFLDWFQCDPPSALWDPILRSTHCHLTAGVIVPYTYFVGAVAALTDFALALLPIWIIWPLQMDWKLRAGLCVLMSTGIVAAVAAILRTYTARNILAPDASFSLWELFLWGELEEWLVIICMCIPPVWPLFRPLCQRFLETAVGAKPTPSNTPLNHGGRGTPLPTLVTTSSGGRTRRFTLGSFGRRASYPSAHVVGAHPSPVDSTRSDALDASPLAKSPGPWGKETMYLELDDIQEEQQPPAPRAPAPATWTGRQEVHVRRDITVQEERRESSDLEGGLGQGVGMRRGSVL